MPLSIVILAAGQGTRMRSSLPKVLQPLADRPLLEHVIDCGESFHADDLYVVHGHGGEEVKAVHAHKSVHWVLQAKQLGTGHAVMQAMPEIPDAHTVLVLYGDVPLVTKRTLSRLVRQANRDALAILTVELPDPTGYGRIVRNPRGEVLRIVEEKDANKEERAICEVNTGLLAAPAGRLRRWLKSLRNRNAQREYYLTDVIAKAVRAKYPVRAVVASSATEVLGVNDKLQLATVEAAYRRREAEKLMRDGVTVIDPDRVDVRGKLSCGSDVVIDVNTVFEGEVRLGDRVRIGPNAVVRNARIAADSEIHPNSVIEDAQIGAGCSVGPFARIRPGTRLAAGARVGNFVEVKKSEIGRGSKVNHLTYIGDTTIGEDVNVGAGTITCNYDGAHKHKTEIGDGAFIGSGVQLVAPVKIGADSTIGAGSTITLEAPPGELTLARARQVTIEGWERPTKDGQKPSPAQGATVKKPAAK